MKSNRLLHRFSWIAESGDCPSRSSEGAAMGPDGTTRCCMPEGATAGGHRRQTHTVLRVSIKGDFFFFLFRFSRLVFKLD